MITQAAKELFALLNLCCGGLFFLGFLIYLARVRPSRTAVIFLLLLLTFVALLNAFIVYFVL